MPEATLITLDEAVGHLRLDLVGYGDSPGAITDERLPDLELKMYAAEGIILDYLKSYDTGWTDETVPGPVKAAILLMLSALWEDREGTKLDYLKPGGAISLLLARYRDPTLV